MRDRMDQDVREEFLRRVAARRGLTVEALRLRLALGQHIAPVGLATQPSLPASSPEAARPGLLSCTGAGASADGSGDVDGALHASTPPPPVSQHADTGGGAGTYGDGTAWGEAAPSRRRLNPLACLALLLTAAWVAMAVAAAVLAVA